MLPAITRYACLTLWACFVAVVWSRTRHGLYTLLKPVAPIQNFTLCLLQLHFTVCVMYSCTSTYCSYPLFQHRNPLRRTSTHGNKFTFVLLGKFIKSVRCNDGQICNHSWIQVLEIDIFPRYLSLSLPRLFWRYALALEVSRGKWKVGEGVQWLYVYMYLLCSLLWKVSTYLTGHALKTAQGQRTAGVGKRR